MSNLFANGSFLPSDSSLLSHGGEDGDKEILAVLESLLNLLSNLRVGDLDVVLRGTVVSHKVEETVIDCKKQGEVSFQFTEDWAKQELSLLLTSWYSVRATLGTSMLWVEGERSSIFFPVKIWKSRMKSKIKSVLKIDPITNTQDETHINGNQVDLSVSVLSGLRGRHVDDLFEIGATRSVKRSKEFELKHLINPLMNGLDLLP